MLSGTRLSPKNVTHCNDANQFPWGSEAAEHKTKPQNNFAQSAKMPLALTAVELLMWEESGAGVCVCAHTRVSMCVFRRPSVSLVIQAMKKNHAYL